MSKFNRGKGITSALLALTMCVSISSISAFAVTTNEIMVVDPNAPHVTPVVSTYEPVSRASSDNVTFDHYKGTKLRDFGSASYEEMVWGKTYHYIKHYNAPNENVDGYTRARWESLLSDSIEGDSGRCWDSADHYIDGMSEAESSWVAEPIWLVAHTYYGN